MIDHIIESEDAETIIEMAKDLSARHGLSFSDAINVLTATFTWYILIAFKIIDD